MNELRFGKREQRLVERDLSRLHQRRNGGNRSALREILAKRSAVERLTTGLRWAKALVWFGYGRYLPAALFRPTPGPNMKARSCEGVSNCP